MRNYYAEQSPRGFANEVVTHRFGSKVERDQWVTEHESDGGMNSAACGARPISAIQARRNVGYRGDAATQNFNSGYVEH